MRQALVVAVALTVACRDDRDGRDDPARAATARGDRDPAATARLGRDDAAPAPLAACPALPRSEPGAEAVARLGRAIDGARDARTRAPLLLERAWIEGRLEDYERALADTAQLVDRPSADPTAWQLRADALARTHQFAAAREAVARVEELAGPGAARELALVLDHAAGDLASVIAARARLAEVAGDAASITAYAATLAEAGRSAEALARIPRAAASIRNNTPQYFAWLLFQWGRIYELAGAMTAARDCFAEAHRRLPGHVESIEHLADALAATGDRAAAIALAREAVAAHPHPALRTLAFRIAGASEPREALAIAGEWERLLRALPLAFADHAARAYLALGLAGPRALELAHANLANRPSAQARELVVEVALAVPGQAAAACEAIGPLRTEGTRRQKFLAWRALAACGRRADAAALAAELGIAP